MQFSAGKTSGQIGTVTTRTLAGMRPSRSGKSMADTIVLTDRTRSPGAQSREQTAAPSGRFESTSELPCLVNVTVGETSLLDKQRMQEEKYGSLYAAYEEKERRKLQTRQQYADFLEDSKMHQMKSDHLDTRKKIWSAIREENDKEIETCKARIEELERRNDTMLGAEEQLREQFGDDVVAWEHDQEAMKRWEAYFSLDIDDLDV